MGARVARKITVGDITSAANIRAEYRGLMTSDDEFVSAFERFSETTSAKCHYLLARLEMQAKAAKSGSDGNIPSETSVEHILPKKPGQEWNGLISSDKDILDDCLHRLGNLCLLTKDKLGNSGFDAKKLVYAKSSHELTKSIADFPGYTRKLVDERQKVMANLAKSVWRFPD